MRRFNISILFNKADSLFTCLHVRLINWTAVTQKSRKSCLHIYNVREYSNVARVTGGVFNVIIAISASAFLQLPLGEASVKFCDWAKHKRYLAGERKEIVLYPLFAIFW